jgi:hypothetical protein
MTLGKYSVTAPSLSDGGQSQLQLDSAGNLKIAGNVASGATDSGNPMKIAGVYNTTLPTLTNGQRGDAQMSSKGVLYTTLMSLGGGAAISNVTPADALSNGQVTLTVSDFPQLYNNTTWDRQRGNVDTAALIAAAGATTSQTGADQTNYNGRGIQVVLDMTTVGTGSVTLTIQGKDAASGKYYTLLAGAAVTTNSTNVYTVYPGAPTTANVSASVPLPRVWRVITTANNANATTYTVGASVLL